MFATPQTDSVRTSHPIELDIPYADGGFHVVGTLCRYESATNEMVPELRGTIVGKKTSWNEVRFAVTLRHGKTEKGIILNLSKIPKENAVPCTLRMVRHWDDFPGCVVDDVEFKLIKGTSALEEHRNAAAERARAKATQARAAARAADERARGNAAEARVAARAAELAKLPLLSSGGTTAFVGADRKCAQQFQEALALDGLEKRKRIADLVTYGCGFIAHSPIRVTTTPQLGEYVLITIADGNQAGRSGWVPVLWVK